MADKARASLKGVTTERILLGVLGILFFGYALSTARVGFNFYDDGLFTYGAWSVAHGRMPYEDFWTLYNPGQFLLYGGFFRFVSESVVALRVFESLLTAASGLIAVDICRRVYSRAASLVAGSCFAIWLGSHVYAFHENHFLTSLFLTLLSADLLLRGVPERNRMIVWAGVVAGACFVIRQDALLYVFFPEVLALCVYSYLSDRREPRLRSLLRRYFTGAAVPMVGMLAWVLSFALGRFWQDAVVFPLTDNLALRALPFKAGPLNFSGGPGFLSWLEGLANSLRQNFAFYIPTAVCLLGLALVLLYVWKPNVRAGIKSPWGFALLALLLAVSLEYIRVRRDFEHANYPILMTFLVAPGLIAAARAWTKSRVARWIRVAVVVPLLLFALAPPIVATVRQVQATSAGVRLSSGVLDGVIVDNREFLWSTVEGAAAYVRDNTGPDDEIFVMSDRNDLILSNYVGFYLLAERFSATRHAELYPGVTTTEEVQREIIAELEANEAPYVVRWPAPCIEESLACRGAPGATLLDEYVASHYGQVADFGPITVLGRTQPGP